MEVEHTKNRAYYDFVIHGSITVRKNIPGLTNITEFSEVLLFHYFENGRPLLIKTVHFGKIQVFYKM